MEHRLGNRTLSSPPRGVQAYTFDAYFFAAAPLLCCLREACAWGTGAQQSLSGQYCPALQMYICTVYCNRVSKAL